MILLLAGHVSQVLCRFERVQVKLEVKLEVKLSGIVLMDPVG